MNDPRPPRKFGIYRMRQGQPRPQRCPACGRSDRPKRKAAPPRLPDGSTFDLKYDATAERWTGRLVVMVNGDRQTFMVNARTAFTTLSRLDTFYRKFLSNKKEG